MLFPFIIRKYFILKVLTWVDGDYGCGLFDSKFFHKINKNSFSIIWEKIIENIESIDLIYLTSQPSNVNKEPNPFFEFLETYPYHASSHRIVLKDSWDDHKKSLKKKLINDTKRQVKRLSGYGEIEFKIANNNDYLFFTKEMISQKAKQYKSTNVKNLFEDQSNIDFYTSFNDQLFNNIYPQVSHLVVNKEIIATHWGIVDYKNKTFFYLMPSYKSNWSKYSPGRIHMIKLLKWCIKNKIEIFDMTGGNESYKLEWSNETLSLHNYLHSLTILGSFSKLLLKRKNQRKRESFGKSKA